MRLPERIGFVNKADSPRAKGDDNLGNMVANLFLGLSLAGAEWVLYFLIGLSVLSIGLMSERIWYYRATHQNLKEFRAAIRAAAKAGEWEKAEKLANARSQAQPESGDFETGIALALLAHTRGASAEVLTEVAQDAVALTKINWERNLALLGTIGSNAPFIGLFGTVLGIIKAFHDLSNQGAGVAAQTVTAGISEALVATAVGLLVAIPAVVAFNLFQRRVRSGLAEAESLKCFLIGKLAK